MNEDVLRLLSSEQQAIPAGELVVRRYRLEGLSFSSLHKFQDAEKSFNGADRVCAVHEYPVCADVLSARGMMEMGRANYAQAETLFTRVLILARSSKDLVWEADTLLNLSWAANEQTHYDEALDRADAARRIALAQGVADTAQKALGNLGWAYYKLGDLDRAERIFVETKNEAHNLGQIASEAGWWAALGYVHADTRDLDAAEMNFEQSLALAKKARSRSDVIDANIALAFVYEQQGKLEDAKKNADEALAMSQADGNKRDETYPRLVLGRIAARQHDSSTAQSAFRQVAASPDAPTFLKWQAEHSLARLYQDENHPAEADREYKVALTLVESARSDVKKDEHRLPFLANATDIYDDYIHFLVEQGKLDQAIQAADFSRARTLSEGLGMISAGSAFSPVTFNAPQISRHAGGTILYYWLGEKQSYLWAITPQKMLLFTLPPGQEIESAVGRYHDALIGGRPSDEESNADGELLYKILVAPAAGLLAGEKNKHVFVVPDGQLNRLNFETLLPTDPAPHYWIEDVSISNSSSLRMLSIRSAGSAKRLAAGSLLLIGDAIAPNSDYPPLANASAEMEMIQKHLGSAKQLVLAGKAATPLAYLNSQPEQFSSIHFVAHGTASRQSPLDSAIVLSKSTTDDDSFKLYARDIIRHKIHADLVTISACYGSGTREYSGEGLVGLSWAFLGAGSHNVIGALWEVSDASTPRLMDHLYDELTKGKSPDVALRAAKLSLLHSDSAFRKPFYWAPFQLYTGS